MPARMNYPFGRGSIAQCRKLVMIVKTARTHLPKMK